MRRIGEQCAAYSTHPFIWGPGWLPHYYSDGVPAEVEPAEWRVQAHYQLMEHEWRCQKIIEASSKTIPPPPPENDTICDGDGSCWSMDDTRGLKKALKGEWIDDEEHARLLVRTTKAVLFKAYAEVEPNLAADAWRVLRPYLADNAFRSLLWEIYRLRYLAAELSQVDAIELLMEAHESTLLEEPDPEPKARPCSILQGLRLVDLLEPTSDRLPISGPAPSNLFIPKMIWGAPGFMQHRRIWEELVFASDLRARGGGWVSLFEDVGLETAEPLFLRSVTAIVAEIVEHCQK